MKWMLLILVLDPSDYSEPVHEDYQIYSSEAACNAAGKALQGSLDYPNQNLRSISVCIPQSAFDPKPLDHVQPEANPDGPSSEPERIEPT
jgi:hypothetical protein